MFPEHGDDAETLMQRADVAMYQAKAARSGHAFYERERDRHSRERLELIGELRDAIGTDQLVLHYQPKLDLASGRDRRRRGARPLGAPRARAARRRARSSRWPSRPA